MLNDSLDMESLAGAFAARGRVVVNDVLDADAAERMHDCLSRYVPWRLAFRDTRYEGLRQERRVPMPEVEALGPKGQRALHQQILSQAQHSGQYMYQSFNIKAGREDGEAPGLYAYEMLDVLESQRFMKFIRALTATSDVNRLYAFAARYTAGSFHLMHVDVDEHDDRRFAFVFGFTKGWNADMGGVLHFLDEEGRIVESIVPGFNTLSMFAVPARHSVSLVSPWVTGERLTVTGWFMVN